MGRGSPDQLTIMVEKVAEDEEIARRLQLDVKTVRREP